MVGKRLSRGWFDLRLLFAMLLMLATTAIAAAERRVALAMANDDYRLVRPLANPAHGEEATEAALKKLGSARARPYGPAGAQEQIHGQIFARPPG
ncbi:MULTISPECIES: hypothetical protein [unclassified Mesorhizobium]|uniref:hypothetical protein n=1 Tax=unclassified Mesorhizobium TaxID=325217 RepID=UPI001CCE30BD|nr:MULTISPECIES: hypothetical protein [unclassified Mesorhizobium]MBZ9680693.1 hypothetical protein [Mesorhizobium sp. CO1-1-2]MBZ9924171.1 hypothetical protein [Mesorhizobium sp. BR1-1-4]